MYFITGRLKVILELDYKVPRSANWDGTVGDGTYEVAFSRDIAWRVRIRCVPDHNAIEQQPVNFLGAWQFDPVRKKPVDNNVCSSTSGIGDIHAKLIGVWIR